MKSKMLVVAVGGVVLAAVGQVEHADGRVVRVVAGPLGAMLVARAEQAAKDATAIVVEGVEVAPCGCVHPNGCDVCDAPGVPRGVYGDHEGVWG